MRIRLSLFAMLLCTCAAAQDKVDNDLLMAYLQEQQFDQVIRYMQQTVQPQHPNGLLILANAFYQQAQYPEAALHYQKILDLAPGHVTAHQQLGNIAVQQHRYASALPHFRRLTELKPDNANCWKQLARACTNVVGMQDSAARFMEKAYALNPHDPAVVSFIAEECMEQEAFDTADSVLKKFYAADSSNVNINALLVKSAYKSDRFDDAVRFGSQLMQQRAFVPIAYMYLAVTYYNIRQYDSCIRVNDFLTELMQDAPETVKFYAALSYAELKQYEKSNALLLECITMAKSKSLDSYYTALAGNYEKMKNYRAAISHYDTAYFLFKDPMRQYGIARIYDQHMQDPQKAKRHYQLYLRGARPETKSQADIHTYVKERVKTLQ